MSEVTVTAQANVLGLAVGQTVTVEETDLIKAHVSKGLLAVENMHTDDEAKQGAAEDDDQGGDDQQ